MRYVIVTPAKNEEKFISATLKSVIEQTILPTLWIIVDDGSTDKTSEIVQATIQKEKWIKLISLQTSNEQRSGGSKVVNAFNAGYNLLKTEDYDFIVKLDADLILPPDYFERMLEEFIKTPKLGLCGGFIYNKFGEELIPDGKLNYHVRGALKMYRKTCFDDINGFKPIWQWDGLDEMEAMYNGWISKSIDVKVIHLRPTSSAYNLKSHAFKTGYEAYRIRTSFFLLLLRFFKKLKDKPIILYSLFFMAGYFNAFYYKADRIIDKDLGKFINKFHFKRFKKGIRLNDSNY